MKSIESITWEFSAPADYPCILCEIAQAVNIVTFNGSDDLTVNFPLCENCSELSEQELQAAFKKL